MWMLVIVTIFSQDVKTNEITFFENRSDCTAEKEILQEKSIYSNVRYYCRKGR